MIKTNSDLFKGVQDDSRQLYGGQGQGPDPKR